MYLSHLYCLLWICFHTNSAYRILLLPSGIRSEQHNHKELGEYLIQQNHEVYMVLPNDRAHYVAETDIHALTYTRTSSDLFVDRYQEFTDYIYQNDMQALWREASKSLPETAADVLSDPHLNSRLDEINFDLAIVSGHNLYCALFVIPYRLSLPYITLELWSIQPWEHRVSSLPLLEPSVLTTYTEEASVFSRFSSLLVYVMIYLSDSHFKDNAKLVETFAKGKPLVSLAYLRRHAAITLSLQDTICIDYHRVEAPHFRHIGGISPRPPNPLPLQIEDFISDADYGIILLSPGSLSRHYPETVLEKLFDAFRVIPQKVLISHDGPIPDNTPQNVFLSNWLPQNDILGNPKMKLLITHAGISSLNEAVYHGVPMIAMPFGVDQVPNADKIVKRGYGLHLSILNFTSTELVSAIKTVLGSESYAMNVKRCSTIKRHLPHAKEHIAFWVEHVVEYGSSHLVPGYIDMPLWRYMMLDIAVLCLLIYTVLVMTITVACWYIYMRCCRSVQHVKND